MLAKKTFTCNECNKVLKSKFSLVRHIERGHNAENNSVKLDKTYSCKECNKVFSKSYNLKRHIGSVHNDVKRFVRLLYITSICLHITI